MSAAPGDLAQAQGCHQQALGQARAIASPWTEAHVLAGLGRCALAAGHATQAETLLREALKIFQRIGAAETAGVSAELDAATRAQSAERLAVRRTDLFSADDKDREAVTNRDLNVNANRQARS